MHEYACMFMWLYVFVCMYVFACLLVSGQDRMHVRIFTLWHADARKEEKGGKRTRGLKIEGMEWMAVG